VTIGPFFDGPHTGPAKMGRAGPFATPSLYYAYINAIETRVIISQKLTKK